MRIRVLAGCAGAAGFVLSLGLCVPPARLGPREVRADAALVLSGDVEYLRVAAAAALYRAGGVPAILMTGMGVGGDSAAEMKAEAVRVGVPPEAILTEDRSRTTRENLLFAAPIVRARGWHRVALVTSASHMARSDRVAQRVLPEIEWIPVAVADAGPRERIYRARLQEWAKLAAYAVRGWI